MNSNISLIISNLDSYIQYISGKKVTVLGTLDNDKLCISEISTYNKYCPTKMIANIDI